jgi:hypothetical protein
MRGSGARRRRRCAASRAGHAAAVGALTRRGAGARGQVLECEAGAIEHRAPRECTVKIPLLFRTEARARTRARARARARVTHPRGRAR